MEDAVSRSSIDSATGDEYVVVNAEPKLKITGDINDIGQEILNDPLSDDVKMESSSQTTPDETNNGQEAAVVPSGGSDGEAELDHVIPSSQSVDVLSVPGRMAVSYEEPRRNLEEPTDRGRSVSLPTTPCDDFINFTGVTYLGSATVNAPRSEVEIYRNMSIFNEESQSAIPVILSVPSMSDGIVRLLDPGTDAEIASYKIHRILFCVRGPTESDQKQCFAFTCSVGDSPDNAKFQCHVFRCDMIEAVARILYSFANTFRRAPKIPRASSSLGSLPDCEHTFIFCVSLDFKEDDGKGNYISCPTDKTIFKFRSNTEKRIVITVTQPESNELKIERCFGLLVSPGRNVKDGDMHLIEMKSMGVGADNKTYVISGQWDPTEESYMVLNTETIKDTRVFLTVAVDLVIFGIQEPVRLCIETKARIFPQNERFWYFTKKPYMENFNLRLKQVESIEEDYKYDVVSVQSQSEMERKKSGLKLGTFPTGYNIPEDILTPENPEDESDGDEPLLSGSGSVSKEVTDENLLEAWSELLVKWHKNIHQRPKQVHMLAKKGIPEALRGEVWQLLAGCQNNTDYIEAYRILITKDSPNEQTILRDINRTFPAHDFFKEAGGIGQDALYKISKAYSVFDEEVGYCQGHTFLAAALLLHMPEEQAFAVLVKIMKDYGLRDLFKQGFEELHLKFYQLERLMQDKVPDLLRHFLDIGLEAHMFASQWFLTLFTAKFPLFMVFHVLDLYLTDGKDVIFSVALALLKVSRKDLLALDFEGCLKYFRVNLPKRFRTLEAAEDLLHTATTSKASSKKLKKYEKEYQVLKEQQMQQEDPLERLERENKLLKQENMRLDQENDDLAHELVTNKLSLKTNVDTLEVSCEALMTDVVKTKKALSESEEEKKRLETEASQLKEMCRRELDRAQSESSRNTAIIADYKQICSQLSVRLEKQQTAAKDEIQRIRVQVKDCNACHLLFGADGRVQLPDPITNPTEMSPQVIDLERQIRELELELAQTKLALVESECKTQDLTHQLNAAIGEIQTSKNTWFHKTISSIREATATKKDAKDG